MDKVLLSKRYKNGNKYDSLEDGRVMRAVENRQRQRNQREKALAKFRNVSTPNMSADTNFVPESRRTRPTTVKKSKKELMELGRQRYLQMLKWKEEKRKMVNLEKKRRKPSFKTGIYQPEPAKYLAGSGDEDTMGSATTPWKFKSLIGSTYKSTSKKNSTLGASSIRGGNVAKPLRFHSGATPQAGNDHLKSSTTRVTKRSVRPPPSMTGLSGIKPLPRTPFDPRNFSHKVPKGTIDFNLMEEKTKLLEKIDELKSKPICDVKSTQRPQLPKDITEEGNDQPLNKSFTIDEENASFADLPDIDDEPESLPRVAENMKDKMINVDKDDNVHTTSDEVKSASSSEETADWCDNGDNLIGGVDKDDVQNIADKLPSGIEEKSPDSVGNDSLSDNVDKDDIPSIPDMLPSGIEENSADSVGKDGNIAGDVDNHQLRIVDNKGDLPVSTDEIDKDDELLGTIVNYKFSELEECCLDLPDVGVDRYTKSIIDQSVVSSTTGGAALNDSTHKISDDEPSLLLSASEDDMSPSKDELVTAKSTVPGPASKFRSLSCDSKATPLLAEIVQSEEEKASFFDKKQTCGSKATPLLSEIVQSEEMGVSTFGKSPSPNNATPLLAETVPSEEEESSPFDKSLRKFAGATPGPASALRRRNRKSKFTPKDITSDDECHTEHAGVTPGPASAIKRRSRKVYVTPPLAKLRPRTPCSRSTRRSRLAHCDHVIGDFEKISGTPRHSSKKQGRKSVRISTQINEETKTGDGSMEKVGVSKEFKGRAREELSAQNSALNTPATDGLEEAWLDRLASSPWITRSRGSNSSSAKQRKRKSIFGNELEMEFSKVPMGGSVTASNENQKVGSENEGASPMLRRGIPTSNIGESPSKAGSQNEMIALTLPTAITVGTPDNNVWGPSVENTPEVDCTPKISVSDTRIPLGEISAALRSSNLLRAKEQHRERKTSVSFDGTADDGSRSSVRYPVTPIKKSDRVSLGIFAKDPTSGTISPSLSTDSLAPLLLPEQKYKRLTKQRVSLLPGLDTCDENKELGSKSTGISTDITADLISFDSPVPVSTPQKTKSKKTDTNTPLRRSKRLSSVQ